MYLHFFDHLSLFTPHPLKKCQTLLEERPPQWMETCSRWADVIFGWIITNLKKTFLFVWMLVLPQVNPLFSCLYSSRSPMGQQTTMQLLPRWTFRGKNLRVYESGGRNKRHASKLWVSPFTSGTTCIFTFTHTISQSFLWLFSLLDKTLHPRQPRPSGRRKPGRSWRSGTCTRVSRWRRTKPTTGELLAESPTGWLVTVASLNSGCLKLNWRNQT